VIAEAGVNHNGHVDTAHRLIAAAAAAGADAVKFQTFVPERLASPVAPQAAYQRQFAAAPNQLAMLRRLDLPREAYPALLEHARDAGVAFLASPFDEESAAFLLSLDLPAIKIGSGEVTNLPFLKFLARSGRFLLLSTGMSTLAEVAVAVDAIQSGGVTDLALLHCVSNYPADAADVNLRALRTLAVAFHLPVGYSDHCEGLEVAHAAVALGACILEKHLTLDRSMAGPDHAASTEPEAFGRLVAGIRRIEAALGNGRKQPAARERPTASVVRKSIAAAHDLRSGTRLRPEMLMVTRPGTGIAPALIDVLVGRVLQRDVAAGTLLQFEDLQ
jgi:N-acetylneuraminate synthase